MSRRPFWDMMDDEMFVDWDDTQMDMYEKDDHFVINLKAPGFDAKNVDISVEGNIVTITGKAEAKEEEKDESKKYYKKEIRTQSFTRSVSLPRKIDADKIQASFKNGILDIKLPKATEEMPKKISIKPE